MVSSIYYKHDCKYGLARTLIPNSIGLIAILIHFVRGVMLNRDNINTFFVLATALTIISMIIGVTKTIDLEPSNCPEILYYYSVVQFNIFWVLMVFSWVIMLLFCGIAAFFCHPPKIHPVDESMEQSGIDPRYSWGIVTNPALNY